MSSYLSLEQLLALAPYSQSSRNTIPIKSMNTILKSTLAPLNIRKLTRDIIKGRLSKRGKNQGSNRKLI